MNERQLENLQPRETTGGVARQAPDDIDHAVLDLIHKLRRLAAQLHRWVKLNLQLAAGFLLDLLDPRHEEVLYRIRGRRQKCVQPKGYLLRN